jgi:hypothetical protein
MTAANSVTITAGEICRLCDLEIDEIGTGIDAAK